MAKVKVSTHRTALADIGEELVELAANAKPINVHRVGDLLVTLAKVYVRLAVRGKR